MTAPTTPEALHALVTAHFAADPSEPLIIPGLEEWLYRLYPAVNFSSLKPLADSPRKYKWERDHPMPTTKVMEFGTIVHGLCLTPDAVPGLWVKKAFKDFRTKEAQQWRDAQTLIILDDEDLAEMTACAESVKSHPRGAWILRESSKETAIFRRHERTGMLLKARLDLRFKDLEGAKCVADIKKLQSVRRSMISKAIGDRCIHAQLAFYCMMDGASSAYLIAVEESAPNDVRVPKLAQASLLRGTAIYENWLTTLAKCTAANHWPGPDEDSEFVDEIEEPVWSQRQTEEITA